MRCNCLTSNAIVRASNRTKSAREGRELRAVGQPLLVPASLGSKYLRLSMDPSASPSEREYFAIRHPDWPTTEMVFVWDELARRGHTQSRVPHHDLQLLQRALHDLERAPSTDQVIFEIVGEFGLSALRPTDEEQPRPRGAIGRSWSDCHPEEARCLRELRQSVWQEIERWYAAVRTGTSTAARSEARSRLVRLGKALGGELRGKRGKAFPPRFVQSEYCRCLFRLRRASELFDVWQWDSRRDQKIKNVAEACGLEEADLRNYLRYAKGKALREGGVTAEYQARVLAGRVCGISEARVANLLVAPGGSRASPKSR